MQSVLFIPKEETSRMLNGMYLLPLDSEFGIWYKACERTYSAYPAIVLPVVCVLYANYTMVVGMAVRF